jgi:hypothetical protein
MGILPRWVWLSALLAAVSGIAADARAAENNAARAALNTITAAELANHVNMLATDAFEGREAGSRGGRAAGGYILQVLEENHVQPAGEDGGYVQSFGDGYRNILGMIPGRDPKLKHECILIGGHYDHVGFGTSRNSFGPTGSIHNGADDNASGTAGVLSVMQAFTALPEPPRRSVLFAFWDGEEKGLLGSKHWTTYPTVPFQNIVFVFNADMIGRLQGNRVEVFGTRSAQGLRKLVSQDNADFGLQLDFMWQVNADSDHYSFFERNVPFLMLHTGVHGNYHRPSDDVEFIQREGMQAVSQLMFRVAHDLAEADEVPAFRAAARYESTAKRAQFERSMADAPPRLGVSWGAQASEPGLIITRVAPGSAADRAGLRIGDRVVRFDGHEVTDGDEFRLIVLAAPRAAQVVIQRPGEGEPRLAQVTLPGDPVRLGFSWDQDRAASSMVMLTRVVPGSAAAQAGLAVRDRVYQVDGREFADGQEFGRLVTGSTGPLSLLVERQGVLHTFTLQPLEVVTTEEPAPDAQAAVAQ